METNNKLTPGESFRQLLTEWTGTILILIFGWATLLQAYVVPTPSMDSTILVGDHIFVDKLCYSPPGAFSRHLLPYLEVKRGDVIVFKPPINIRETYVKRAIGIPGDHIKIVNRQLYVNGNALEEPYKRHANAINTPDPYLDNFPSTPTVRLYPGGVDMLANHANNGEVVVPPGYYFAMGDNRDVSSDSRFWGFVPRENIVGKPLFIYWSYDAPTERLVSGIDPAHIFDIATNFFSKTRWNRMMRPIRAYPLQ